MSLVFIHNNAPFHVSKVTYEFFEHKIFSENKEWPQLSPDLNPIENLSSIMKMKLYESLKQYKSKADLWEVIKTTVLETEPPELKILTNSMAVIEKRGYYISMLRIQCLIIYVCYLFYYTCWSTFDHLLPFYWNKKWLFGFDL